MTVRDLLERRKADTRLKQAAKALAVARERAQEALSEIREASEEILRLRVGEAGAPRDKK